MKIVRSNVFEVNSSSTHSISIADNTKDFVLDTIYPDNNGNIELEGGKFGWEFKKYNESIIKANYVTLLILYLKDYSINNSVYNKELNQFAKDNYQIIYDNFIEIVKEQTKCNDVVITANLNADYEETGYSYIDHQSIEDLEDFEWLIDKEKLHNFLFNKNSWLFTGNDNDNSDLYFYDVPTYKKDNVIEKVTYKYKLDFFGKIYKDIKFKEYPNNESFTEIIDNYKLSYNSFLDKIIWNDSNYNKNSYKTHFWLDQDIALGFIILVKRNEYLDNLNLYDRQNYVYNNLDNEDLVYKVPFQIIPIE